MIEIRERERKKIEKFFNNESNVRIYHEPEIQAREQVVARGFLAQGRVRQRAHASARAPPPAFGGVRHGTTEGYNFEEPPF